MPWLGCPCLERLQVPVDPGRFVLSVRKDGAVSLGAAVEAQGADDLQGGRLDDSAEAKVGKIISHVLCKLVVSDFLDGQLRYWHGGGAASHPRGQRGRGRQDRRGGPATGVRRPESAAQEPGGLRA